MIFSDRESYLTGFTRFMKMKDPSSKMFQKIDTSQFRIMGNLVTFLPRAWYNLGQILPSNLERILDRILYYFEKSQKQELLGFEPGSWKILPGFLKECWDYSVFVEDFSLLLKHNVKNRDIEMFRLLCLIELCFVNS